MVIVITPAPSKSWDSCSGDQWDHGTSVTPRCLGPVRCASPLLQSDVTLWVSWGGAWEMGLSSYHHDERGRRAHPIRA